MAPVDTRIAVRKTYKMYVNGAFVRSEQGRVNPQMDAQGTFVANYARANRKDFRDAVVAARKAQAGWAARSAFNRGQILYRIAEMLEDRAGLFTDRLSALTGASRRSAGREVNATVDRVMYYAGWADKLGQVVGAVNPVASSYFNFSVPEPVGVVALFPSPSSPLLGFVTGLLPILVPGNTCVAVAGNTAPVMALDFAEVLATSDVPAGVANILAGDRSELLLHAASHMDVNGISCFGASTAERKEIAEAAAESVKRVQLADDVGQSAWQASEHESLYRILPFLETKTAWHPIGL